MALSNETLKAMIRDYGGFDLSDEELDKVRPELEFYMEEMKKLEDIGRVHREGKIYFLNGVDEWQKKINLSENHSLWIDTFRSTFGENFVRIKETKKTDGKWNSIGNIIITKNKIKEVSKFLDRVDDKIRSLN